MALNTQSIRFKDATTLTIASGVVTATQGYHIIASESGTADDLDTITADFSDATVNSVNYRPMLLIKADTGDTITIKHGTGNIQLSNTTDYALSGDLVLQLFYDGTNWVNVDIISASSGEANTASNVGTAGVGIFKQKTGVDLEFKKLNAGSTKITITDDVANDEVDVDVSEANLTLDNIGGTLSVSKGGTGATTATGARTNLSALGTIGSSTDNAIVRFDGTGGDTLQNSTVTIGDFGEVTVPSKVYIGNIGSNTGALNTGQDGVYIYRDGDATRYIQLSTSGTTNEIASFGTALNIQNGAENDVDFFAGATSGENPNLTIHGYSTTDAAVRDANLSVNTDGHLSISTTNNKTINNGELQNTSRITVSDSATTPPLNITERASTPSTPSSNDIYLDDGTNTASGNPQFRRYTGATWEDIGAGAGGGVEVAQFAYRPTLGTNGDAFTTGAIRTATLNSTVVSQSWASISTNQLTLNTAGTYVIEIMVAVNQGTALASIVGLATTTPTWVGHTISRYTGGVYNQTYHTEIVTIGSSTTYIAGVEVSSNATASTQNAILTTELYETYTLVTVWKVA